MIRSLYKKLSFITYAALAFGTISQAALALPATHAYISVPELNTLIKNTWAAEIAQYQDIIDQVLEQETTHDSSHHVFYHAQKSDFRIVQDFIKAWYEFLHPDTPIQDFHFLRPWYELPLTIDANTFIDTYEQGTPKRWNDHDPFLIKHILSVNFSLFGSTRNYSNFGECTFKYFFKNRSIKAPPIENLLIAIFDHFGFDKKEITTLLKLNEQITTEEGSLFQIFVPQSMVDQISYAAKRLGAPYRDPDLMSPLFNHKKQRYTALSPILEVYRNNPMSISDRLDRLQGRLLFSQNVLLNPQSGVKIFRYTTISPEKLQQYQHKLTKLTKHIFKKWLKNALKGKQPLSSPLTNAWIQNLALRYGID